MNHLNRPQLLVAIAGSADKKIPVLHAHKKMKVLNAELITAGAIAASGVNYVGVKLQKSAADHSAPADLAQSVVKDTQLGVAAYGHIDLAVSSEIILEKGETLYLNLDITGALTVEAALAIDAQVIGN